MAAPVFEDFDAFLDAWREHLERRVSRAVERILGVPGVLGVLVGGSFGGGAPWPFSDIDLLPVYEDGAASAETAVADARAHLLDEWVAEGFRTPLDVGWLCFRRSEVEDALRRGPAGAVPLMEDMRWYHTMDKGYRGRPRAARAADAGLMRAFSDLLTEARFRPDVEAYRRGWQRCHWARVQAALRQAVEHGGALEAARSLVGAAGAAQGLALAAWGERDNSMARAGTRFERAAVRRGQGAFARQVMDVALLDPASVRRRLSGAPAWVRDRSARQRTARLRAGEAVSEYENARDVLQCFAGQELRHGNPPHAAWVGVDREAAEVRESCALLNRAVAGAGLGTTGGSA